MNNRLRRAIQQILLLGSTAAFTASTLAAVGQQNPPPGPGHIPDYFGVVPNFANSPQPVLTQVNIIDGNNLTGVGASATPIVTNGAISGVANLVGGSGYVTPTVTITDQPTGTGASLAARIGGGIEAITLSNAGTECIVGTPVTITDTGGGNGAAAIVSSVDGVGAITGINITSPGSGYTASTTTVSVSCGGATGQSASGSVTVTPGNPGDLVGITIISGGSLYSSSAIVTITDTTGTGATATPTVDTNGTITGFNVTPGLNYSANTTVSIQDVSTGTGAQASAASSGTTAVGGKLGVIQSISIVNGGSGYRNPLLTISDASATGGSGAQIVATTYDYVKDAPTDKIMDVQVLNAGSNYDAHTKVTVTGGPGSTPVNLTPIITNGTITGFLEIPNPTNPIANFVGLGSGFKTPLVGTGIRKFVDALPGIPGVSSYINSTDYKANGANDLDQTLTAAVPDTTTFPGSDYYIFAEQEHTQKLHTDLPGTHLRGYVQLDANGAPKGPIQYLGPIIIAKKDRPVRIKLVNQLTQPLTVPVDTTYMGADTPDVIDPVTGESTDKRTSMHLHGGNTPWISDGTARQWVKPKGDTGNNKGETARNVPDMWFKPDGTLFTDATGVAITNPTADAIALNSLSNDPGDGALTFFYTNEQSARLMFYHDHAEGTTRLNVYAGMAGGYILEDDTEQSLVTNGTLPSLADTIPLIIQEKTFVPDDTTPVLNFYGPFRSALNSQDPTWRWGSGQTATGLMGTGDLWVPHVFMPNQNPGDVTGANSVGRWDYGPWFWPPFVNIQNGEIANPYWDSNCNTTTSYCEPKTIPGVPNGSQIKVLSGDANVPGGVLDHTSGKITESPSGTPEAFNDTPLVNGTAYPYINVDPKQYRLRILSVGNDRMLNLSMVVAASKKSADTSAAGNAGTLNSSIMCDGTTSAVPADCTEVKMVPWNSAQDAVSHFPTWWYTKQKGGVTFDGRPSGVFDPATRGPAMVQIGTEGGFLSTPVVIKNQPVNYEYNPKNILIGNVKEHALLLGPAERADVLVDFTNFAGSTLILYNDNPAPMPAWDLRLDYYTSGFDNTDTGGAFSVVPGYGPNSRTLMQIRVSKNGGTNTHPVDALPSSIAFDANGNVTGSLVTAVQAAFKTSQEPIIVPQSVYNNTYGINATDALGQDLSKISDTSLTYTPLDPATRQLALTPPVKLELEPKSIIEDWTQNWGRMNALLGVEIPRTTATVQTSIPQAFVDPVTELVKITPNDNMVPISGTLPDGTQIWKITHNGVDSHAVHFHLFHVQIVNRVGWDGAIYPPDANELGWKDTVRMNPLSDTIVALRPMTMTTLPFKVPNSHRLVNPSVNASPMDFFNLDPLTGNASNVTNVSVNYGWEYLWHCHILGHEENDMMRTIAVAQPPEAPSGLTATTVATGVKLDWTDNSIISNWVTIQRSLDNFTTVDATINVVEPECTSQAGCARTYTDTTAPVGTSVYYKVMANNTVGAGDGKLDTPRLPDGSYGATLPPGLSSLTPGFAGYANVTANSGWSNTASVAPNAQVTPTALTFTDQPVNTTATKSVTVTNSGNGNLLISGVALPTGTDFTIANNGCPKAPAVLAPAGTCTIDVSFKPTSPNGIQNNTLTITDNSGTGSQTVNLTGNGVAPTAVLSTSLVAFGSVNVNSTGTQSVVVTNNGTAPLSISNISTSGAPFTVGTGANACVIATPVPAGQSCTIYVNFAPTTSGAVNPAGALTISSDAFNGASQIVSLTGVGTAPLAALSATSLSFGNVNVNTTSATQPVTLTNNGNISLNITGITASAPFAQSNDCVSPLAAGASCTVSITFTPTATGAVNLPAGLTITDDSNNSTGSTQTVALTGTGVTPVNLVGVTNLTAQVNAANIMQLNWTDGSTLETGYQIQRCAISLTNLSCAANSAGWVNVTTGILPAGALTSTTNGPMTVTLTANLPQNVVSYRVYPLNGTTVGPVSNTVSVDMSVNPLAPTNVTAAGAIGSVNLTWIDVANNNIQYRFRTRYLLAGGGWSGYTTLNTTTVTAGANATSRTLTAADIGATYLPGRIFQIQVGARNQAGTTWTTATPNILLQ